MVRGLFDIRSSGLGSAVKEVKRASKHVDKGLAKAQKGLRKRVVKTNRYVGGKVKERAYQVGKERMADRMSSEDRRKFILSETKKEMDRQKKSNKKKYGYESYKPIKVDKIYSKNVKRYGEKAKEQRNRLVPAKPKYNKWGDRIA
jgi:hypothetical protein